MFLSPNTLLHQNLVKSIGYIQSKMITETLTLSIAESCTGGLLSSSFTSLAGASNYFKGGMVTYSTDSKIQLLGIQEDDINDYGVASEHIVTQMASNIREKYNTDFGLATTGYIDGFDNASHNSDLKDQHYAWICVASKNLTFAKKIILNKDRVKNAYIVSVATLKLFIKEIL